MNTLLRKISLAAVVTAALSLVPAPAAAQDVNFAIANFRPAISPLNYFVTDAADVLPHFSPSAALYLSYVHRPLQLVEIDNADDQGLVNYQVNMDLMLGIGLFGRFELGLALPATLAQGSDGLESLGRDPAATLNGGIGDIRIIPKAFIHRWSSFALAFAMPLSMPSGSDEQLLGGGFAVAPRMIASLDLGRVSGALNFGFRFRPDRSFMAPNGTQKVTIGNEFYSSVGVRVGLWKEKIDVVGDFFWALQLKEQDKEEVPIELAYGLRFYLPLNLTANLGLSNGLTRGLGTPSVRVFGGIAYQYKPTEEKPAPPPKPTVDPDPDRDGILGAADACPDTPEDKDNFEDEDGCPDTDNDKDGILDTDDRCPNEPEDKDGFEDADGCPDLDNDKDGIPDKTDKCVNDPEDKDGFEDEDGCPDTDNDKDGILDVDDKCPNEPEVFNGVDDDDGCPDKGKGKVQIQHGKITVPPVYFATGRDRILRRSHKTLKEVFETLQKNTWVKKIRIEGHTDDRGKDAYNLDLSQRRASNVLAYLIKLGLDPNRAEAKGFGETQPIASNKNARGRAKNRRVEFVIVDPPQSQAPAPAPAAAP